MTQSTSSQAVLRSGTFWLRHLSPEILVSCESTKGADATSLLVCPLHGATSPCLDATFIERLNSPIGRIPFQSSQWPLGCEQTIPVLLHVGRSQWSDVPLCEPVSRSVDGSTSRTRWFFLPEMFRNE